MFEQIHSMKTYADNLNDLTFTDYVKRLTLLSRSLFEWHNLPNNMSEKWIETYLFNKGYCVFFKDKTYGYISCLMYVLAGLFSWIVLAVIILKINSYHLVHIIIKNGLCIIVTFWH